MIRTSLKIKYLDDEIGALLRMDVYTLIQNFDNARMSTPLKSVKVLQYKKLNFVKYH